MSSLASSQISPRIVAAHERLDAAVSRIEDAVRARKEMVDAGELEKVNGQLEALQADNLALSQELEAYGDNDYDSQFEEMKEKMDALYAENESIKMEVADAQDFREGFSARIDKLIGNVQQVLEEG